MRSTSILNRSGQHSPDGWYHIEKTGSHPGVDATGRKVLQICDLQSVNNRVAAFQADNADYAASHPGEPFPGMLVDREHFSHDASKETAADGWLMDLQNRNGELCGRIQWTRRGKAATSPRSAPGGKEALAPEYKYFSTEFNSEDLESLGVVDGVLNVRPKRLSGLTLTNRPNNLGATPIANRSTLSPALGDSTPTQANTRMKSIATKLGLTPEASEKSIHDALDAILNSATTAKTLKAEVGVLTNRVTELLGEQIDLDIAAAGIVDQTAIATFKPVLAGMKNREERTNFLKLVRPQGDSGAASAAAADPSKAVGALTNRTTAKPPGSAATTPDAAATKASKDQAHAIQNRATAIMTATPGMSAMAAFTQAKREIDAA